MNRVVVKMTILKLCMFVAFTCLSTKFYVICDSVYMVNFRVLHFADGYLEWIFVVIHFQGSLVYFL